MGMESCGIGTFPTLLRFSGAAVVSFICLIKICLLVLSLVRLLLGQIGGHCLDLDCKIRSCYDVCLSCQKNSLSLPLAVSTVASAINLGIVIPGATHDLTGHFSFLLDCNATNGFGRLLVAVV